MKEYKKPLIEDELVEIQDICEGSGLRLSVSNDSPIVGDGDNTEDFIIEG